MRAEDVPHKQKPERGTKEEATDSLSLLARKQNQIPPPIALKPKRRGPKPQQRSTNGRGMVEKAKWLPALEGHRGDGDRRGTCCVRRQSTALKGVGPGNL